MLKTGEMLELLKMLKVLWGIDPPPPEKNLQTGEMLKHWEILKATDKKCLKLVKC